MLQGIFYRQNYNELPLDNLRVTVVR